jgi:hypothetical protein
MPEGDREMTREQLEALMTWAKAMVRYEDDPGGAEGRAEERARESLYDAFGIPLGEHVNLRETYRDL